MLHIFDGGEKTQMVIHPLIKARGDIWFLNEAYKLHLESE